MTGDRLAFAAITTLYLLIAIPWEERSLRAELRRRLRALHARRCGGGSSRSSIEARILVVAALGAGDAGPRAPFSMNTIECCDGMSNFLPHVLQVTESSTRIM